MKLNNIYDFTKRHLNKKKGNLNFIDRLRNKFFFVLIIKWYQFFHKDLIVIGKCIKEL